MTKTDYKYRLSFSRNDKTTGRFYNISCGIDNPEDPAEVEQTIKAIKSDGMGDVLAGLESFVDFQLRTQPEAKPPQSYDSTPRAPPQHSTPRHDFKPAGSYSGGGGGGSGPKPISEKQTWFLEARLKEGGQAVEIIADFMDAHDKHNIGELTSGEAFNLIGRLKGGQ